MSGIAVQDVVDLVLLACDESEDLGEISGLVEGMLVDRGLLRVPSPRPAPDRIPSGDLSVLNWS